MFQYIRIKIGSFVFIKTEHCRGKGPKYKNFNMQYEHVTSVSNRTIFQRTNCVHSSPLTLAQSPSLIQERKIEILYKEILKNLHRNSWWTLKSKGM